MFVRRCLLQLLVVTSTQHVVTILYDHVTAVQPVTSQSFSYIITIKWYLALRGWLVSVHCTVQVTYCINWRVACLVSVCLRCHVSPLLPTVSTVNSISTLFRGGSKEGSGGAAAPQWNFCPPLWPPTCENFLLKLQNFVLRSNVDYVLKIRPIMFCNILMIYITY